MKPNMTIKSIVTVLSTAALLAVGTLGYFPAQETLSSRSAGELGKLNTAS